MKNKETVVENKEVIEPLDNAPPTGMLTQSRLQRFGKIFFNMSIAACVLIAIALLSTVATQLLFIGGLLVLGTALIGIVIFTAGAAFFMPGNPVGFIWGLLAALVNSSDSMGEFVKFCFNITKWISLVGIVLAAIAITFISINKSKQNFATKIVVLSIFIIAFAVVFAFQMITGGMQ